MAEYINKNDIRGTGLIFTGEDDAYTSAQADGADKMWNKILSLPTVTAIPISEGVTNGDMIKAMFPNVEITEIRGSFDKEKLLGYRTWLGGRSQDYLLDWWNESYK